jgi:hypothetical protein
MSASSLVGLAFALTDDKTARRISTQRGSIFPLCPQGAKIAIQIRAPPRDKTTA